LKMLHAVAMNMHYTKPAKGAECGMMLIEMIGHDDEPTLRPSLS
jgi:hypothetical protein